VEDNNGLYIRHIYNSRNYFKYLHHFRGVDRARLLQDQKQFEGKIQRLTGIRAVHVVIECIRLVQFDSFQIESEVAGVRGLATGFQVLISRLLMTGKWSAPCLPDMKKSSANS
jgi:hypothetical protein